MKIFSICDLRPGCKIPGYLHLGGKAHCFNFNPTCGQYLPFSREHKMKPNISHFLSVVLIFLIAGCSEADLVLLNGNVVTLNPDQPVAQAIAIKDDRILQVGSNAEIKKLVGLTTRLVDLDGQFTMPGIIDAHAHFLGVGQARQRLDFSETQSWAEVVQLVAEAVKTTPKGQWILGRGWHQEKWPALPDVTAEGYPVHNTLSAFSPDHPVMLGHASGHGIMVNAKAMEMAGIRSATADPEGGRMVRLADGQPSGIFLENAGLLISNVYEQWFKNLKTADREAIWQRTVALASESCLRLGITSFHDAGSTFEDVAMYKKLAAFGQLKTRLYLMLLEPNYKLLKNGQKNRLIDGYHHFLTVRAVKQYMDGALGSRGAWLLEPYSDMPETRGLNVTALDSVRQLAGWAAENEFQVCTHAIGDRANREVLDIYEAVIDQDPKNSARRWRIEHAQHLQPQDIPRFGKLGVIASMQGIHCTSDGPWVAKRIGQERAENGAYVWRSLIDSGAHFANGTDAPVERLNPFENFYALITRQMKDGEAFYSGQCLTRDEALQAMTVWAAYAAFEENLKGKLQPGMLADITVLDRNLLTADAERIPATQVLKTFVGGRLLYEK